MSVDYTETAVKWQGAPSCVGARELSTSGRCRHLMAKVV